MKIISVFLFCLMSLFAFSQNPESRISELITKSDWFTLEEEYPKLKDSIQSPFLKQMAEVMIFRSFNQPQKAINGIDVLLTNYKDEIGDQNYLSFMGIKTQLLAGMGRYAESAETALGSPALKTLHNFYAPFSEEKAPSISRPKKDVVIPIEFRKVREDKQVVDIPVSIHGKNYEVILDSGSGLTFFSESFAKDIGVRILKDSINIAGVGGDALGWFGILDKLKVGEIEYKDILCAVAPPDKLDSVIRIDAILGLDFLKQVKEFQFYPQENKLVFPYRQSDLPASGRNLLLSENQSYLKTHAPDGERLIFHFDTGNAGNTSLFNAYYEKHKKYIEANLKKEQRISGGFGGIYHVGVYIMPEFIFKVGDAVSVNKIVPIFPDKDWGVQTFEDGSVGMHFMKQFDKITVNYDKMFLKVE